MEVEKQSNERRKTSRRNMQKSGVIAEGNEEDQRRFK